MLFRENFASPWGWHSAKRGHKLPNLHKRVKFEGRIKGFSAEWENFEEGYFLKHFRGGGGQNLPKVLHSSASFEILHASLKSTLVKLFLSIQEQELDTIQAVTGLGQELSYILLTAGGDNSIASPDILSTSNSSDHVGYSR